MACDLAPSTAPATPPSAQEDRAVFLLTENEPFKCIFVLIFNMKFIEVPPSAHSINDTH